MKLTFILVIASFALTSCMSAGKEPATSAQSITDPSTQDKLFHSLTVLTQPDLPEDSLAFLVLPLEASCPSCRDKVINSIMAYQNGLQAGHYIILTAGGGQKIINSYFRDLDGQLPQMPDRLFLDSTHQAGDHQLFEANPVFYYAHNRRVYKKVSATPSTVKRDLREFFSGSIKNN